MGKLDTQSTVTLVLNGEQTKTSLRDINSAANATRAALSRMNEADNPELYRQRTMELQALTAAQRQRRQEMEGTTRATEQATHAQKSFFSEFKAGFANISSIATGAGLGSLLANGIQAGISAVKGLISSVIDTYSEFQKFDAVLTNTLGDSSKSQAALKMLSKFAAETPFSMQELTASYVKFVNRGLIPTKEELTNIGDLAASQGKSFDQLTEAILDAMSGEFERLKEFGIRGSKNGETVKLTFKGVTQEVKNTEESITQAILAMGKMTGVAGGMESMSKRIGGVWSNIGDNADRALNRIGEIFGGVLYTFGTGISNLLGMIGDARSASEKLTDEFDRQNTSVQALQKETLPLLDRYEVLKSKTKLTKEEHAELNDIIAKIRAAVPGIANEFDKYNNVIGISTERARAFIKEQQAMLRYVNKSAIEETEKDFKNFTEKAESYKRQLKSGYTEDAVMNFITGGKYNRGGPLTSLMRERIEQKLAEYTQMANGAAASLKKLKGIVDEPVKKEPTVERVKQLSEMTVGELKERIKALNQELEKTIVNSDSYKKIAADIKAAEDILNAPKKQAKEDNELKKYLTQLESIRSEFLKLSDSAQKGTIDELDAQLAVLDDKYQKVVDKLQKLANDPKASGLIKKELKDDINAITKKGGLRDQAKDKVRFDFNKKQEDADQKEEDDQIKAGTGRLDNLFAQGSADLDSQQAMDLRGVDLSNPAMAEAQRLNIKEIYAQKTYELEQKHLESMRILYESYGKDTGAIDKKIAENTIKENDRAAREKIAKDKAYIDAKLQVQQAEKDMLQQGSQFLMSMLDKRSMLYKAALIVDKTTAMANVIMNTEVAIAKYAASVAALGPAGIPLLAAYKVASRVSEGFSIAAIIKAAADGLGESDSTKKAKKGALIPSGPSHDEGGIDLINNRSGDTIAEMEGGEPIMILSKDTYANNRMLINELLYNSQYRNGAPVNVNTAYATRPAGSMYQKGGMISIDQPGIAGSGAGTSMPGQPSETNELLKTMLEKFDEWAQKPWEFPMRQFFQEFNKNNKIDSDSKA